MEDTALTVLYRSNLVLYNIIPPKSDNFSLTSKSNKTCIFERKYSRIIDEARTLVFNIFVLKVRVGFTNSLTRREFIPCCKLSWICLLYLFGLFRSSIDLISRIVTILDSDKKLQHKMKRITHIEMVYIKIKINNNRNNKEIKSVGALSQYLSPNFIPKIEIQK